MSLMTCSDLNEAVALEAGLGLYLKPVSKLKINVQLPKLSLPGQSISTWNVMEKLRDCIKPDVFLHLKSLKIMSNVIKFEGELETKAVSERALARLRGTGSLKLSGFSDVLQIRAAHAAPSGPMRHDWEAFFRDAKGVNEMKPGERPDTVHLEEIPVRWFSDSSKSSKPSEKLLRRAFGNYGRIRRVEIPEKPVAETFVKTSSLSSDLLLFEVYIQYEEYVEFSIAMDSLRGKKLLYKDPDGKVYSTDIKVDFDRTNYLSQRNIKRREMEAKKLSGETAKSSVVIELPKLNRKQELPTEIPNSRNVEKETALEETKLGENEAKYLLRALLLRAEVSEKLKVKNVASSEFKPHKRSHEHKLNESKELKHVKLDSSKRQETQDTKNADLNLNHVKLKRTKTKESDKNLSTHKESALEDIPDSEYRPVKHATKSIETQTDPINEFVYEDSSYKKEQKLLEQERALKAKLLKKLKLREEEEKLKSREELRKKLAGRNVLKSVLVNSLSKRHKI